MQFIVKTVKNDNPKGLLQEIGFDDLYLNQAAKKHSFLTLKIKNLAPHIATIIKETALSKGCDAGVNKGVLLHETKESDLILSGTIKQLEEISKSLSMQPFGLKEISKEIKNQINLNSKNYEPKIVGILNITEDSSSDGGNFLNEKDAIEHGLKLIENGADIIDIGAESTKPNAKPVEIETEIKRLYPVAKELKKCGIKISIDTRNSKTAEKMIELSADIINDVSGLEYDKNMINIIKNSDVKIVITHSRGTPETMDNMAQYDNLIDDIYTELQEKVQKALKGEINKERLIIDSGFGFAKNTEQNFKLLNRIKEFNSFGIKTMAGVSRKRFLKSIAQNKDNESLDNLTMLACFYLFENKTDYLRVHNVEKTKIALDFYNSIYLQKSCL